MSQELTIDMHTHPFSGSIPHFLEEMDRAKVGMAAPLFSIRDKRDVDRPEVRKRISARLQGELAGMTERIFNDMRWYINSLANPSNKDSAELAKKYPGKFIPFGSVHMHADEYQLEEELKEIETLRLFGVKLLPTLQLFNPAESKNFERVCEWCEKKRKVIIYHTGCDPGPFEIPAVAEDANPKYLRPVLECYSPKIVLAHFGSYSAFQMGIWFEEALDIVKRFENALADTSAAVDFLMTEHNLKRIRKEVGLNKLLFGTDFPVVGGSTMRGEAASVRTSLHLSDEEKRMVLSGNAKRLMGV
jgi:predicted TIM-barrel fold metal-dependent hydrolase